MRLIPALAALALLIPAAAHADDATVLNGRWEGWYSCPKGEWALTLDLTGTAAGKVTGTLGYGPMGSDTVSKGSYAVEGGLDGGRLSLKGVRWIDRPPGDEMLGLVGKIELDRAPTLEGFAGEVQLEGCDGFLVARPPETN